MSIFLVLSIVNIIIYIELVRTVIRHVSIYLLIARDIINHPTKLSALLAPALTFRANSGVLQQRHSMATGHL